MSGYQAAPNGNSTVPQDFELPEAKKLYGGLTLWIISLTVPLVMMMDVRYIMAGGFVSPRANQWLGVISTVLMIISGVWVSGAPSAIKRGDLHGVAKHEGYTILFGWAGFVLIGWQLFNHSVNPVSHYGETFLATLGVADFYVLFALIALISVVMRVKRLGPTINHRWAVHSTAAIWRFVVIAWIVLWIIIYLI